MKVEVETRQLKMEAHNFGSILTLEASEVQGMESEVEGAGGEARAWEERVLTVREDLAVFGEVSAILPAKVIMINPWNYNSLNRAAKRR